jgi:hypothetical protein
MAKKKLLKLTNIGFQFPSIYCIFLFTNAKRLGQFIEYLFLKRIKKILLSPMVTFVPLRLGKK